MDRYLNDHSPLTSLGKTHSPDMIASALSLLVRDVVESLEVKWVTHGFSRKPLEAKSWALEKTKNWKASNVLLALLIYKVILFSDTDYFSDTPIIDIFLSNNHVPDLLVDVYYYHQNKHEKKKSMIMCYASLLNTCLMSLQTLLYGSSRNQRQRVSS